MITSMGTYLLNFQGVANGGRLLQDVLEVLVHDGQGVLHRAQHRRVVLDPRVGRPLLLPKADLGPMDDF
jgi:hypothetical protein